MQTAKSQIDKRALFIAGLLLAAGIGAFAGWESLKVMIRDFLESPYLKAILSISTFVIFIVHHFQLKSKRIESERIITKQFGDFIDHGLGGIAYAVAINTSLTLLKGLFIQTFFDEGPYFMEFESLDLSMIFIVATSILYYSLIRVGEVAKETFLAKRTELVTTEDK